MKKNYFFLVLTLLLSAAWTSSSALVWEAGPRKTSFKAGDKFVMVGEHPGTWWGNSNYLNGFASSSATLLESCVLELEATGENGHIKGYPSFYLKQISTGQYMGGGGMKVNKADAYKYEILVNSKTKDKYVKISDVACKDSLTVSANATEESVVFITYSVSDGTTSNFFLGNGGSVPVHWSYSDTNSWMVYSVTSHVDNVQELAQLITLYTESLKLSYISVPSNSPGYYPAAAVARYDAAMEEANKALLAEDDPRCLTAMTELRAAQANVDSLGFPMKEGYYRFRSALAAYFAGQSVYKGMYVDANDNRLKWKDLALKDAYFIFKVTKNADGKNWNIQNLGTDRYAYTAAGATTLTPTTPQTFKNIGGGEWNLANTGATTPYHTDGHGNGAGKSGVIVTWGGGRNTASAWYIDEVADQALIDSLTLVMAQVKLNLKMKNLVATAKTTYQRGWTNMNMITNANQLSSNAVQLSEGKIEYLLDGDPATFFHSRWGGEAVNPPGYHYLQVQLNKPITEFQFYTRMRNNNNRPDSIVISASNDKNNWTEITRLPNANDTLPYAAATPEFSSSLIALGGSYSNVRFTVIATSYGGKRHQGVKDGGSYTFNGYPFFTYSEFQMYPSSKVDPNSQNYAMPAATALKAAIDIADTIKVAATEAQIATLQAAIDAYNSEFVDTTRLTKAITAAQALVDNAIIGTSMGEVAQADVNIFASAVAAAKAVVLFDPNAAAGAGLITRAALDAAVVQLKAAENIFASSVVSVVPNMWYYIQNRMSSTAADTRFDAGIYTVDGVLKWGGLVNGNFEKSSNAAYMWRFVAMSDSTYAAQNMATGQYMNLIVATGTQVKQSATPVPYFVKYIGNAQFSLIASTTETTYPLHAQAAGSTIVGWSDGINSASAWTFVEAAAVEIDAKAIEVNSIFVSTLPFEYQVSELYYVDADGIDDEVKVYSIVGKEGPDGAATAIKLHRIYASVPAGMPVIIVTGDYAQYNDATPDGTLIYTPSKDINNPDPKNNLDVVATPLSHNGLVGVFNNRALPRDGVGLLELGKLRVVKASEVTGYMAGYIDESLITEIPGLSVDLVLPVGEGPALSIDGVTGGNASKVGKIYTVDGVYVGTTTTGLKSGLYIINGKVVRL